MEYFKLIESLEYELGDSFNEKNAQGVIENAVKNAG
jgi:hypothetical protein